VLTGLVPVVARMRRVLAFKFSQSRLDEHREAVEKGGNDVQVRGGLAS